MELDFDPIEANDFLGKTNAEERVRWGVEKFENRLVLSSSFGAQAAVMLHLAARVSPNIPVIFIDTGYLFSETYKFAESLVNRLGVNLNVYRSKRSPAWQEALHGK